MSQEYETLTGLEIVRGFCREVLAYGIRNGLSIDGIKIWVSPEIVKSLEIDEYLIVKHQDCVYEIPVIINPGITEVPLDDGSFQSDIYVGSLEWRKWNES